MEKREGNGVWMRGKEGGDHVEGEGNEKGIKNEKELR